MANDTINANPMRLIGYWIESLRDSNYLPPQEFVGTLDANDRVAVADYLDRGEVYQTFRGYYQCLCCGRQLGHSDFADGYWIWPDGLGHYVRDHDVVLPTEFIQHVLAGTSRIPKALWNALPMDTTFWIDWCRRHSLGKYQSRIIAARIEADREVEELFAATVAAREAKEGVSVQRCQWRGCERFALNGRVLCAACCTRAEETRFHWPYSNLRKLLRDE